MNCDFKLTLNQTFKYITITWHTYPGVQGCCLWTGSVQTETERLPDPSYLLPGDKSKLFPADGSAEIRNIIKQKTSPKNNDNRDHYEYTK